MTDSHDPKDRKDGTLVDPDGEIFEAIMDETDSGLDIDALRIVSNGVNAMRNAERATVIVTHYQRLLNYIVPDFVHVLSGGRIVKSGGKELALELEDKGYSWIEGVTETVGS